MKKWYCLRKLVLLWLILTGVQGLLLAQENLLQNPYFESWTHGRPDHWQFREVLFKEDTQVLRGTHALGQKAWESYIWQDVDGIEAGGVYIISYWYHDNDPATSGGIHAYWKQGGVFMTDDANVLRPEPVSDDFDGWQAFTVTLVAPAGADGFRFGVKTLHEGPGGGSILFDDFSLVRQFHFSGFGHETFDRLGLSGTTYQCGSFIGEDGLEWTYYQCRGNIPVDGPAIQIGPNRTPRSHFHSPVLEHGIGTLSFDYMQALTTNVNLQVLVNDQVVATFTTDDQQGEILNSGPIDVHIPGDAVLTFMGTTNSSGHVAIDNIIWTPFDPDEMPAQLSLPNLASLRQRAPGHEVIYEVEGEVVVTWPLPAENTYYIQDETAGVIVRDSGGLISAHYGLYDGLAGIRGRLLMEDGLLYLDLSDNPGPAVSTANEVIPTDITVADLLDEPEAFQSQLVRLDDVYFVDPGGVFDADACYIMRDGTGELLFCLRHASTPYAGEAIPEGLMSLTALAGATASQTFVTARYHSDMQMPLAYAVVFTVADDTESLKNVDLTGDMTGWDLVGLMEHPAHNWSVTLNIPPGAYAWNALGTEGEGPPFWLMPGEHLQVTVTEEGQTKGDVSFVYLVVSAVSVDVSVVKLYPNPAGTKLHIEAVEPITRIQVVNTRGHEMYMVEPIGEAYYALDVGDFTPGLYVVRVQTEKGLAIEKIQVEP